MRRIRLILKADTGGDRIIESDQPQIQSELATYIYVYIYISLLMDLKKIYMSEVLLRFIDPKKVYQICMSVK